VAGRRKRPRRVGEVLRVELAHFRCASPTRTSHSSRHPSLRSCSFARAWAMLATCLAFKPPASCSCRVRSRKAWSRLPSFARIRLSKRPWARPSLFHVVPRLTSS
jgi:hypothetical protein